MKYLSLLSRLFIGSGLIFVFSMATASQIILGLDWEKIAAWRYWEIREGNPVERMIIWNREDRDMNLNVMLARIIESDGRVRTEVDSSYGVLSGPWEIPAKNYIIVNTPQVEGLNADKYLLHFAKKDHRSLGVIPLSSRLPERALTKNIIITTEGLNGSGGSFINCWWEHPFHTVKSGERFSVILRIKTMKNPSEKDAERSILIPEPDPSPPALPRLQLVEVKSQKLERRDSGRGIEYMIPWENQRLSGNSIYSITFQIEALLVNSPTIATLPVWHSIALEGQNISLPIVIVP